MRRPVTALFVSVWLLASVPPVPAVGQMCSDLLDLADGAVPAEVGDGARMEVYLNPQVGPQLSAQFTLLGANAAVGDALLPELVCIATAGQRIVARLPDAPIPPSNADLFPGRCIARSLLGSVLSLQFVHGKVSYLNPSRRSAEIENTIADERATGIVRQAALAFGVPEAELGRPEVRDLMIGARNGNDPTEPGFTRRIEKHVQMSRTVNGLPVFGSVLRGAVDANGAVGRLYVRWPDFRLAEGLSSDRTLPRSAVTRSVGAILSAQNPCGSLSHVEARIAYVPGVHVPGSDDEEDGTHSAAVFLPALVVHAVPKAAPEDSGIINAAAQELVVALLHAGRACAPMGSSCRSSSECCSDSFCQDAVCWPHEG